MQILQAVSVTSGRYSVPSQTLRSQNIQSNLPACVGGSRGLWKLSFSVVPLAHDGQSPPVLGCFCWEPSQAEKGCCSHIPGITQGEKAQRRWKPFSGHELKWNSYTRSAYTEQEFPLLRSKKSKELWKGGIQCNFNFHAILTIPSIHSLQMNQSLFSNTSTWDGTSHLARKIQNVLFWEQYMHVFKTLNYKDMVITSKIHKIVPDIPWIAGPGIIMC